jgi:hypothetical protein
MLLLLSYACREGYRSGPREGGGFGRGGDKVGRLNIRMFD